MSRWQNLDASNEMSFPAELHLFLDGRLWSLGTFAVLMAGAMLFGSNSAPTLEQALCSTAMLAGATVAFHVVTWGLLRAWIWYRHERR